MATILGIAAGIPVLILIIGLHCICANKREKVFPTAELDKFKK